MSVQRDADSLFDPNRNCWRVEHADHAAFLVDGDEYFRAFVAAASRAQRSLLITGWDFHSRTRLLCSDEGRDCELELGAFLNDLAKRRRDLEIHILIWDYPMVFGMDREWAALYGLGWQPHRRVHFRYDNTHPVGGSHHQKVVVVDDAIGFCGGIDLTCRRWDTHAHAAADARRVVQGTPYPPFHDLIMAVDGAAARGLGDLFRERWRKATGETLAPVTRPASIARRIRRRAVGSTPALWPEELHANVKDVQVALSRTEPAIDGSAGVREVEALYVDMIAAAQSCIYIENQYFTSEKIGDALAARLAEEAGPEVVVVLRQLSHGWLEELTMQTLRTRLIARMRAADRFGRFRIYYPFIAGLADGTCIDVHSKMIIIDDRMVRIGSSNIANRSMGLDTECDLTIDAAGREDVQQQIRALRARLLGEHLGADADQVQSAIAQFSSVRLAIEHLRRSDRTLMPLSEQPEISDALMSMISVADPERPVALSDLAKLFTPEEAAPARERARGHGWLKFAALAMAVGALTALWKLTPLADLVEPQKVTAWARHAGGQWWAPLLVLFAYTPACLVMFPRPVITLFAVVAFGPWLGFVYSMLGIQIAAWLTYVGGQRFNRDTVRRMAGRKVGQIVDVLRRRGLIAVTALRLVPIAPFAVEGLVAGAVHIKLWHFLLGTGIGMLPGTLAATVFGDQLQAALEDPGGVNYWLIAGVVLLLVGASWAVRRWLTAQSSAGETSGHSSSVHHVSRERTA